MVTSSPIPLPPPPPPPVAEPAEPQQVIEKPAPTQSQPEETMDTASSPPVSNSIPPTTPRGQKSFRRKYTKLVSKFQTVQQNFDTTRDQLIKAESKVRWLEKSQAQVLDLMLDLNDRMPFNSDLHIAIVESDRDSPTPQETELGATFYAELAAAAAAATEKESKVVDDKMMDTENTESEREKEIERTCDLHTGLSPSPPPLPTIQSTAMDALVEDAQSENKRPATKVAVDLWNDLSESREKIKEQRAMNEAHGLDMNDRRRKREESRKRKTPDEENKASTKRRRE